MVKAAPCTPRQRMLAAYEGRFSDTVPVAPEFWYYIPARLLGLSMIEFEQEIPHWQALHDTFRHYRCERRMCRTLYGAPACAPSPTPSKPLENHNGVSGHALSNPVNRRQACGYSRSVSPFWGGYVVSGL